MILLDVTPHALGIMTFGGYFEELIPQNTTVPTHRTKIFTTSRDNQTAVKILVMQGEKRARRGERAPRRVHPHRPPPRAEGAGRDRGDLRDQRRRHRQRAARRTSRPAQEQSIQVTASSGLTRDEIKNDDRRTPRTTWSSGARPRSSRRAKQEAEKLIGEIERLFPQVEQIVASSDFGRDAIEKARAIVGKARAGDRRSATWPLVKEQIEGLTRTHRMFKGVVAKT